MAYILVKLWAILHLFSTQFKPQLLNLCIGLIDLELHQKSKLHIWEKHQTVHIFICVFPCWNVVINVGYYSANDIPAKCTTISVSLLTQHLQIYAVSSEFQSWRSLLHVPNNLVWNHYLQFCINFYLNYSVIFYINLQITLHNTMHSVMIIIRWVSHDYNFVIWHWWKVVHHLRRIILITDSH